MRIGFDAKRLYNNFTGLGNHSRTTIDILTAEFPDNELYLYTPRVIENSVTMPYYQLKQCHTRFPEGMLKGSMWRTFQLANDAKADGVDLFHGLSNELPVGLHRNAIPSVVTIHDVAFKTFTDMYHWHDRQIYNLKWKYACEASDRIIAISECTKRDIIRFYDVPEEKIDVLYQPVNIEYYKPVEAKSDDSIEPYMLYVGSVNSRKNLLGIVKAMAKLPKDLQIPLIVVGNGGAYRQQVEQYIAEHNLEKLVRWEKAINVRTLKRLYTNATLFLYPSFYEGFGLPVVEAQLCGCPVITSNVSSLPEAGGSYALSVSPENIDEIRDSIVRVLTDDSLRQKMIQGGRAYAYETFHPSSLAHQLMDIYHKLK